MGLTALVLGRVAPSLVRVARREPRSLVVLAPGRVRETVMEPYRIFPHALRGREEQWSCLRILAQLWNPIGTPSGYENALNLYLGL
jgi:hypothetical protein